MELFYIFIFFLLGLIFGSFFTVVGSRLPKGENFITSRSECDRCHHELALKDMVPLLSFFLLKGRCRYCKGKIDTLSSYMEFFTGVLFALSYYVFGFSFDLLIALGVVAMLIILSVSDISYYIIPDQVLIFFSGYFLILTCLATDVPTACLHLIYGIILFGIMYTIMLLGNFLFKKESLGGGDVKLMFVMGLIIHPFLGLIVIFFASLLALPISFYILYRKSQSLIPFGPFLLISFTFIYFTGIDVSTILNFIRLL